MAIVHELTEEDYRWSMSRVLIAGEPDSGKTESSRTFKGPTHLLSYPGEGGINSIPKVPYIKPYIWREDANARASSKAVVDEIKTLTIQILTGEYGPIHTFFGDGVHRFYEYFIDMACGGRFFKGQMTKEDWLATSQARTAFKEYLKMVKQSSVPVVVFTTWSAYEPDKPGDVFGPRHVYPDLVGKMARDIMGEFSLILSSQAKPNPVLGKPPRFRWQIKPSADIRGASIKIDPEIWASLPDDVAQNWPELERLLLNGKPGVSEGDPPKASAKATTKK